MGVQMLRPHRFFFVATNFSGMGKELFSAGARRVLNGLKGLAWQKSKPVSDFEGIKGIVYLSRAQTTAAASFTNIIASATVIVLSVLTPGQNHQKMN